MYPCTKFQSIWRTLVFVTKFVQKTPQGLLLRQTEPDNKLILSKKYHDVAGFKWFQVVPLSRKYLKR